MTTFPLSPGFPPGDDCKVTGPLFVKPDPDEIEILPAACDPVPAAITMLPPYAPYPFPARRLTLPPVVPTEYASPAANVKFPAKPP